MRLGPNRLLTPAAVTALAVTATLVSGSAVGASSPQSDPPQRAAAGFPSLRLSTPVTGLSQPWDVKMLPRGRFLISERETRRLRVKDGATLRTLSFPSSGVWSSGETGLMGLEVDPKFVENRRIYTCHGGFTSGGGHEVKVVVWRMNITYTGVAAIKTLVSGISATSGRHGGCRLLISTDGSLYVGTGDATIGTAPQNLSSLNGKVLRVNRVTGAGWPTNPYRTSSSAKARLVFTYGHRNVQGLAQRHDGRVWSVEHGTDRDDEVNLLGPGANFGWNPVPSYNETAPMTDQSLPGTQNAARWSSGDPTIATSGAVWVRGAQWGAYAGTLAVAALKGSKVVFMKFDASGNFLWAREPASLQNFGRLRSMTRTADGNLLVTTANGSGDRVIRISPN